MINYKLDISYNGKNYFGWQKQKNYNTIQQTIEEKLKKIFEVEQINLIGASRIDAKAHAIHQIANFKIKESFAIPPSQLLIRLNNSLPIDIRINSIEYAPENFHSRFDAKKREYKYLVYNNKIPNPFLYDFSWFYPYEIEFKKLKKTVKYFIGTYNFISFVNISKTEKINPVRTIYDFNFKYYKKYKILIFTIVGNSFLKGMIRNIIGTVLKINQINQSPSIIKEILNSNTRIDSIFTAPASGLFLYKVYY